MKEQLHAYIRRAFADLPKTQAVRELEDELTANMDEKYDDLVAGGMTPQEAYNVVIDGIGDLGELRGSVLGPQPPRTPAVSGQNAGFGQGAARSEAFPSSVQEIKAEWLSGDIRLLQSPDGLVHVVEYADRLGDDELFQAALSGDVLSIRDGRSNFVRSIFGLGWLRALAHVSLEIYLPAHELRRLRVNAVSGNIEGEKLAAAALHLETVSGRIEAAGMAEEARIKTTSGSASYSGQAGKCALEAVSGKVRFHGAARECRSSTVSGGAELTFTAPPASLEVSVVSGRTTILLPENDGFSLRFDKVSGRFDCDFPVVEQGGLRTYKDGGIPIRVNTVSGGCSLRRGEI